MKAHILVEDYGMAYTEITDALRRYPQEKNLYDLYFQVLSHLGDREKLGKAWQKYRSIFPDHAYDSSILEFSAWGVIGSGVSSSLLAVRLTALIAAAFTGDARAVPLLLDGLRSSQTIVRCAAARLSGLLGDAPFRKKLLWMLTEERNPKVLREVIPSIAMLEMAEAIEPLRALLVSEHCSAPLQADIVDALTSITQECSDEDLHHLVSSDRAGLRLFACSLLGKEGRWSTRVEALCGDPHHTVRQAALQIMGLFGKEVPLPTMERWTHDDNPLCALLASWALALREPFRIASLLLPWIDHTDPEIARYASSLLATTGSHGIAPMRKVLHSDRDIFIRAHAALGLIGQGRSHHEACCVLLNLLADSQPLMWKQRHLFSTLAPSTVGCDDLVPNFPQVVDSITRLDILNIIASIDRQLVQDALVDLLKEHNWGISAMAAVTLMKRGNDAALDVITDALDHDDPAVRIQAALVLALWGKDHSVVPLLQKEYHNAAPEQQATILEALGILGLPESLPFLVEILHSTPQCLATIAAASTLNCLRS